VLDKGGSANREVIRVNPEDEDAQCNLGLLAEQNRPQEAEAAYR
jgi:hypothetical protein